MAWLLMRPSQQDAWSCATATCCWLYSDGVLESRNNADQEFGFERIEAQLRRARSGSAEAVLFSVLAAVQDFAAPHALIDDTSLVAVRYRNDRHP